MSISSKFILYLIIFLSHLIHHKLIEHNFSRTSEQALEEQRRLRAELQADVGAGRGRAQEIQAALEAVGEQLGDARVDKHEDARRKKKQEIVENFKREIPGVVCIFYLLISLTI